jgi:hypothetical protein
MTNTLISRGIDHRSLASNPQSYASLSIHAELKHRVHSPRRSAHRLFPPFRKTIFPPFSPSHFFLPMMTWQSPATPLVRWSCRSGGRLTVCHTFVTGLVGTPLSPRLSRGDPAIPCISPHRRPHTHPRAPIQPHHTMEMPTSRFVS